MKNYETIMGIGSMDLRGFSLEELPGSSFVVASGKIDVPERKMILVDSMTAQESRFFMNMRRGGLTV